MTCLLLQVPNMTRCWSGPICTETELKLGLAQAMNRAGVLQDALEHTCKRWQTPICV